MAEVAKAAFREWCVVEIMGHKRYAGLVTEAEIGGCSFLRVDVPESVSAQSGETLPAFTKLFGQGSVYCLSPTTEETARAFAAGLGVEAFSRYEAPRLPGPPAAEAALELDDGEWDPCGDGDDCPV